mmetsp:Transcript_24448/g.61879  ORF Transcript_24448/g.61879 Transcript_24448/m.61879 type:complete len:201 (-) Transcript_24448:292-894(-)
MMDSSLASPPFPSPLPGLPSATPFRALFDSISQYFRNRGRNRSSSMCKSTVIADRWSSLSADAMIASRHATPLLSMKLCLALMTRPYSFSAFCLVSFSIVSLAFAFFCRNCSRAASSFSDDSKLCISFSLTSLTEFSFSALLLLDISCFCSSCCCGEGGSFITSSRSWRMRRPMRKSDVFNRCTNVGIISLESTSGMQEG